MYGKEDQAHGLWMQLKGRVKRVFGRATGDRKTQAKGAVQEAGGQIQEGIGNLREQVSKPQQRPTV